MKNEKEQKMKTQEQAAVEALFKAGVFETDYSRRVIGIRWRLEHGGAE